MVFAHTHLVRIAATFARAHPGVEIEIVADDGMTDPVEDRFDIVIRANPSPSDMLVGKRIVRTSRVVVAARDLPMPLEGDRAPLVFRSAEQPATSWHLVTVTGPREILLTPVMKLSTLLMIREAVIYGVGAALLPHTLVAQDLTTGVLACWGTEQDTATELWALHTSARLPSAKVVAFLHHLENATRA